jgi:hypothetical protein
LDGAKGEIMGSAKGYFSDKPDDVVKLPTRTESWVDQYAADKEAVKQINELQRDFTPDRAAEIYDLSKKTGLPASVVQHAFDEVKGVALDEPAQIPRYSVITDFRGKDHIINGITGDDTEQLDNVVGTWEKTKRAYEEGDIDSDINWLIYRRELLGENQDIINPEIERLTASRKERIEATGIFEKFTTATARQLPQMISTQLKGAERAMLGAITGATGAVALGQVPPFTITPEEALTVPAAFTGGLRLGYKVGTVEGMFAQEFGSAWQDFSEIRDEEGNPLNPILVKVMATGSAGVNALLEFLSFKKLLKTIPGGDKLLGKISKEAITDTLMKKAVKDKLMDIAKDAGKAWTTEIWTEVLQEVVPMVMGETVKGAIEALGEREFAGLTTTEVAERISGIVEETMYSALGFIIPGTSARVAGAVATSDTSQKFFDDNMKLNEAVNETKTKERSPDHAQRFLDMIGMGQPVFISAEGINTLYQENTKKEADATLHKLGVNPQEARQSAIAGQDIEVNSSEVHARLEREEFNKLAKDMKPAPSAYTQRELDGRIAEEDVKEAVKLQQERAQEDAKVKEQLDRLRAELKAAKIETEAVETTPVLLNNMAERISYNSEKSKSEVLGDLSFKRMPFERFKGLLQKGKELFQSAFHGTPFKFDKFSLEHLGKGEGAQAFGWGLYFAEKKDVADWYRRNLVGRRASEERKYKGISLKSMLDADPVLVEYLDRIYSPMERINMPFEEARKSALNVLSNDLSRRITDLNISKDLGQELRTIENIETIKVLKDARKVIENLKRKDLTHISKGATFKVELPGDDQILDWEKPLSEQEHVLSPFLDRLENISQWKNYINSLTPSNKILAREMLRGDVSLSLSSPTADKNWTQLVKENPDANHNIIHDTRDILNLDELNKMNGRDFYDVVGNIYTQSSDPLGAQEVDIWDSSDSRDEFASKFFSATGIKGHKFWDGSSRNRAGDKTFNFVIYDDEVIEIVESFFQAKEGAPPKGAFNILENNRKSITLFESADLSTILHESAHFAFNEYIELERAGTASESLIEDLKVVRQWVGAEEGAELTTPQLEQFAKGFEMWIFEGKAPNIELESIFARFQRWLVNVYKTAKSAQEELGVKLNKDIRGVFERMVSASDGVTTAVENLSLKTDEELNALGVIEEDKRYMKRAIKDIMRKAERKLSKALNRGYRDNVKRWRDEARAEVREQNPIYNTIDNIVKPITRDDVVKELELIRGEIESGEYQKRAPVRDAEGYMTDEWIPTTSTYPEYFQNKGVSKKEAVKIINKAIEGKVPLTDRQEFILNDFVAGHRDVIIRNAEMLKVDPPPFPEDTKFDKIEFIELYGKEALKQLPDKKLAIEFGMSIDETAITYGYDGADAFIQELLNTKPFNEAVAERVNDKRARHDAQFQAENFVVGTKEYSDYVDILSKYVDKNLKGTPRERKLISRAAINRP